VALREQSLATWLIYPCTVYILQGAAWLVAYSARRKPWMVAVGLGWLASAVAMGLTITFIGYFVLFAAIGIWTCMALPGWIVLRGAPKLSRAA
jgi:hypothetical protein